MMNNQNTRKNSKIKQKNPSKLKKNLDTSEKKPLKTPCKQLKVSAFHLAPLPKTDPPGLTLDDFISKRPAFYPTSTTQSTRISGLMQKSTAARGVFVTDLNPGSRYDSIHSSQIFIAFK